MSTTKERHKTMKKLNGSFEAVVNCYMQFLIAIAMRISDPPENLERNKRKFFEIRKELHKFLNMHKNFFELTDFSVILTDNTQVGCFGVDCSSSSDGFIKLDDVVKCGDKITEYVNFNKVFYHHCIWTFHNDEILKRAGLKLKQEEIDERLEECITQSNFLIEDLTTETKCSNYKHLQDHVRERIYDYCHSEVSTERINKISLKFDGKIENFENEISCNICFNDFENDQEICRLPCNHFLCKVCALKWFIIPQNGSDANFQCPFCRDDCT